jgi:hypothetical protein
MLEAYLTSASSLDVKLKILIQIVMAEKRLIKKNPLSAFQWNILKPLVTLQTLRISHDLLATYPEPQFGFQT